MKNDPILRVEVSNRTRVVLGLAQSILQQISDACSTGALNDGVVIAVETVVYTLILGFTQVAECQIR